MPKNIDKKYLLAMLQLPRYGRKTVFKLLRQYDDDLSNTDALLGFISALPPKNKLPLFTKTVFAKALTQAEDILRDSEKADIKVITYYGNDYPVSLKHVSDPPIVINVKGNHKLLNDVPAVAIVGTREPTEFGYNEGLKMGEIFAKNGFNIVSGLAVGCDTAAHLGCLRVKGMTTAVLAHGLNFIYPMSNERLAEDILKNDGCLLSEYFVNTRPRPSYFIERDRIQAGLGKATIVIETDINGGTMYTVKSSIKEGRKVACVSNHPVDLQSHPKVQGNKKLISEGAVSLGSEEEINNLLAILKGAEDGRET